MSGAPRGLAASEKEFLKTLKKFREVLKLEQTDVATLDKNQQVKLSKKSDLLQELGELVSRLPPDTDLVAKHPDIFGTAGIVERLPQLQPGPEALTPTEMPADDHRTATDCVGTQATTKGGSSGSVDAFVKRGGTGIVNTGNRKAWRKARQTSGTPQTFKRFAVLDFEATCWPDGAGVPRGEQEVIELPTVVVDAETLETVAEFHQYVRPTWRPQLSAFCTELTGIEQDTVDAAGAWREVWPMFLAFCAEHQLDQDDCCFVTCGDWDLRSMLPLQCHHVRNRPPRFLQRWANIKKLFEETRGQPAQGGMAGMLQRCRLPLLGRHHSGIDDSRNIAQLLKHLIQNGCVVRATTWAF